MKSLTIITVGLLVFALLSVFNDVSAEESDAKKPEPIVSCF